MLDGERKSRNKTTLQPTQLTKVEDTVLKGCTNPEVNSVIEG